MNFHVLTLFSEMIEQGLHTSILGKAMEKGYITLETTNIRDFSANKYNRVDDYPYGGGAGMVMEAEPVYRACKSVEEKIGKSARTVYLTPQGRVLNQTIVEELAMEEDLILLCGHYEGIDERVLEEVVTDYISIGDYVLTGGELGAMVLIDAVSRFVPGVLSNEESSQFESLQDNLAIRRSQENRSMAVRKIRGTDKRAPPGPAEKRRIRHLRILRSRNILERDPPADDGRNDPLRNFSGCRKKKNPETIQQLWIQGFPSVCCSRRSAG